MPRRNAKPATVSNRDEIARTLLYTEAQVRKANGPCLFLHPELFVDMNGRTMPASIMNAWLKATLAGVCEGLEARGHTVAKVSDRIRKLGNHLGSLGVDTKKRNGAAYAACIPVTHWPATGFAVFPPGTGLDHPLIIPSLKQHSEPGVSRAKNGLQRILRAAVLGNLSIEDGARLTGLSAPEVQRHVSDKQLPAPSDDPPSAKPLGHG